MKEAYESLKELKLKNNDYVVVAISGGPDSMALLSLFLKFKNETNINIICAHVNHNVRKESEIEEQKLKEFCEEENIIFETLKIQNKIVDNFHNEAHKIRYDFFTSLCSKYNSKYLFTAHHGDDLMETILMRVVRGSSLKGYSGFAHKKEMQDYSIIRPLIHLTKEEILKYNKENNILYFHDKSNDKDIYTRNRYRKYLLPFLKKEDKEVHHKFYKFSETLLEYNDYIEKEVAKQINVVFTQNEINLNKLKEMDNLIQKKIIENVLEKIYDDSLNLLSDTHVSAILKLIHSSKANTFICLPNNLKVKKTYEKLVFQTDDVSKMTYKLELENKTILPNGHCLEIIEDNNITNNFVCRLNTEEIQLPLYVRNKKEKDKMIIKGMTGHKKIKDIFINEKIDLDERYLWPVVVDSTDTIVWLPGLKKSQFDKQKKEKYDIIIKYD